MVLAMPSDMPTPKSDLPGLTPKLAAEYARAGPRTLTRDINRLVEAGLIVKRRAGYQPHVALIQAFLPPMADPDALHD